MSHRIRVSRRWWGGALVALAVVASGLSVSSPAEAALGTVSAGGPYSGHVEGEHFAVHGTADGATSHTWTAVRSPNGEKDGATCQIADKTALDTTVWCNDDGLFNVILTATDGSTTQVSKVGVMLGNVDPAATITAPSPGTAVAPHAVVALSAQYTDPGYVDSHHYTIAWGDGETSTAPNTETQQNGGTGFITGQHSYANPGSYTITLTVFDSHTGSQDSATTSISVVAGQPCARVSGKGRLPHHRRGSSFSFSANCGSAGPVGRVALALARHGRFRSGQVTLLRGSGNRATFSGTGKWQQAGRRVWHRGYSYLITAVDNGRNTRRRHDKLNVVVRKPSGTVVLRARGAIAGGNITVRN